MSRNDLIPDTFERAVAWLRDHEDELVTVPYRLHARSGDAAGRHTSQGSPVMETAGTPEHDGLGSPPFSAPFWAILVGTPFATRWASEMRACPEPRHGPPYPICERCNDQYAYNVHRELYVHPLAAALATARPVPATSPSWPTPFEMVVILLRADFGIELAGSMIGRPILGTDHRHTLEAAFTLAVQKVVERWASGPIPRTPRWTDLSPSQQAAMDAA